MMQSSGIERKTHVATALVFLGVIFVLGTNMLINIFFTSTRLEKFTAEIMMTRHIVINGSSSFL